jgi:hypothetical protein
MVFTKTTQRAVEQAWDRLDDKVVDTRWPAQHPLMFDHPIPASAPLGLPDLPHVA